MAFLPTDPRGPDQRRKQLLAKIMGQQHPTSGFPSASRAGSFLAGMGRPFGAANAGASRLNFTHGSNVAQSVLSRLGIGANPNASWHETGAGEGMPIPVPTHPDYPPSLGGTPIPVPGVSGGNLPPQASSGNSPVGTGIPQATNPFSSPPPGAPAPFVSPPAPSTPGSPVGQQLVDLGNGLFYDPYTDKVVGNSAVGPGSGVRHLGV